MLRSNEDRLVIFVHIPKTAGKTMNKVLRRQYGWEACHSVEWGPEVPEGPSRHLGMYVGIKLQPGDIWYPEGLRVSACRFLTLPEHRWKQIRVILWHMSFGPGRVPATVLDLLHHSAEARGAGAFWILLHD